MNKNVYDYLKLIEERERDIQAQKEKIAEEIDRHEKIIRPLKQEVNNAQHEINRIRDERISVSLMAILKELAKKFDTKIENLNIEFTTSADTCAKISTKNFMNKIRENQSRSRNRQDTMTFVIKNKGSNNDQSIKITNLLILSEIQADGKTLEDHSHIQTNEISPGMIKTSLVLDDYSQIILRFQIKSLYETTDDGIVAKDIKSQAIIDASTHESIISTDR